MKYLVIAALAMTAGWYLLDGRFSYMDNGTYRHCVDRLTGERCQAGGGPSGWYGSK